MELPILNNISDWIEWLIGFLIFLWTVALPWILKEKILPSLGIVLTTILGIINAIITLAIWIVIGSMIQFLSFIIIIIVVILIHLQWIFKPKKT